MNGWAYYLYNNVKYPWWACSTDGIGVKQSCHMYACSDINCNNSITVGIASPNQCWGTQGQIIAPGFGQFDTSNWYCISK